LTRRDGVSPSHFLVWDANTAFFLKMDLRIRTIGVICGEIFMSNVPSDLKYTKSHEWVRINGDTATVGITDHAQHELTDIVFVELPEIGKKFKSGEACAVVESVKTASDIYSPISGEILETNKTVVDNPALANTGPYTGGWFFKIKLNNPAELDALLSPEKYKAQING
jgi:glycine cleavage system H protein